MPCDGYGLVLRSSGGRWFLWRTHDRRCLSILIDEQLFPMVPFTAKLDVRWAWTWEPDVCASYMSYVRSAAMGNGDSLKPLTSIGKGNTPLNDLLSAEIVIWESGSIE